MGALDGYKILDFTTLLPGPYATMTLADLGAEVLKVSGRDKYDLVVNWPPVIKGAQVTGAQAWLGRNKKTIFLNLKKPAAVEAVKKLVMEYDIVVEQFRPGVMDKLGVGRMGGRQKGRRSGAIQFPDCRRGGRLHECCLQHTGCDHLPGENREWAVHRCLHAGQRHPLQFHGRCQLFCRRPHAHEGERSSERRRNL